METIARGGLLTVGAVVDATQPDEDINLLLPLSRLPDECQGSLPGGDRCLILPQRLQDGALLGVEPRDHAGIGGWGQLLRGLQRMAIVRVCFHIGEDLRRAITREGAVFQRFGPPRPVHEMVGQCLVVLRQTPRVACLDGISHSPMQLLPAPEEYAVVRHLLHQGMLKGIARPRRQPALIEEFHLDQLGEALRHHRLSTGVIAWSIS